MNSLWIDNYCVKYLFTLTKHHQEFPLNFPVSHTFPPRQKDKVGELVTNLGSPDAPHKAELNRNLKEL